MIDNVSRVIDFHAMRNFNSAINKMVNEKINTIHIYLNLNMIINKYFMKYRIRYNLIKIYNTYIYKDKAL